MNSRPSAIMFGAGNVGRGFLGQLFSESGYEVVFVDMDEPLIAALNDRHAYTIRLVDNAGAEEVLIAPVRALRSSDVDAVAEAVSRARIGATAVGVRALPHIAPLIAAGIERRLGRLGDSTVPERHASVVPADTRGSPGFSPLNIIVCENMKNAANTLRSMVLEHLDPAYHLVLDRHVGFVDTVIARMVPPPTPEMRALDPSLIVVEPYRELPVDHSGFVGSIPEIVGMTTHGHFAAYTASKLYIHNCGHAILGYLGYLRGYEYGYQALADADIRSLMEAALAESRQGIVTAHGADEAWLEALAADVVRRFGNRALGDTVFRLARDPLRKLGPEDRLVGAARLAERAGIAPDALSWGIAAAYCFDHPEDPLALNLQQRLASEGLDSALTAVSGILPDEPLGAGVRHRYQILKQGTWPWA